MKKSLMLFSTCVLLATVGKGQLTGAGLQPKYNFSRQVNVIQTLPKKFARTTDNLLSTPGIGLYVDYKLGEQWKIRTKAGYETKGFVFSHSAEPKQNSSYRFNYIDIDLNVMRYWGKNEQVQPYTYAGISTGYLVSKKAGDFPIWYTAGSDPSIPENYADFDHINFGYTAGVGLSFNDVLWLELERNGDLISSYRSESLKVRNVATSINVGINLLKIFSKA